MGLETLDFFLKHFGDAVPDISVLDVGASGGTYKRWGLLGNRFSGLGIEPLIAEVDRLNHENTYENFSYVAAFVVWREWENRFPSAERSHPIDGGFARSSAAHAEGKPLEKRIQENYNAGQPLTYSNRELEVDEIVEMMPKKRIDFLKSDTDGYDLGVLYGGSDVLAGRDLLALNVECLFHGDDHPYANHFANIDNLLRKNGFTLLDLTTNRYSRVDFPARFVWSGPSETNTGQVLWGDAYYFRDFCNPDFETIAGWTPTATHIIRQAMLLELARHIDSCAELVLRFAPMLGVEHRIEELLDKLVLRYSDPSLGRTYQELTSNFRTDITRFYPS